MDPVTARRPKPLFPQTSETADVTKPCLEWLKLMGFFAWRQNVGGMQWTSKKTGKTRPVLFGFPGLSDILGVLPDGKFLAVETKRYDGVVSDAQRDFLADVTKRGGVAIVAYCLDDLEAGLRARGYVK
jgi:hypothetical protein